MMHPWKNIYEKKVYSKPSLHESFFGLDSFTQRERARESWFERTSPTPFDDGL